MKNCFHGCQQPAGAHLLKPHPQRLEVAQHLFGGRVGKRLGQHIVLEQLIVRGDDVLDLRAVLGLLQAQRIGDGGLLCRAGIPMKIGSVQQHPSLYANLG